MIKLERNRNLKREVWDIIAIKGKISKILNKYEIEVYFAEENGIKYYEFFYHPSHAGFFVEQTTEITEQEIINSFKEMLALLKNPVEKQKMIDYYIKADFCESEDEFEMIRRDVDNYEKQVEDFVLEVQGIKKRPNFRARFKLLKKVRKNWWEFKTDKYIFRVEKYKYRGIWWDAYELYRFNIENPPTEYHSKKHSDVSSNRNPKEVEDLIIFLLEEESIEKEREKKEKEYINKIDWSKAFKGIFWYGAECKISLNKDGTLHCYNDENLKQNWEPDIVVDTLDVYDKDGNCLSTRKEYNEIWNKIYKRAIKNGYKKYKK